MGTLRHRCVAVAMVVLAAGVFAQLLFAQRVAERVKKDMARARALERGKKYAEAVNVYPGSNTPWISPANLDWRSRPRSP